MILLEESWSELFLMCAIQFCLPMENSMLFSPAHFSQHLTGPGGVTNNGGTNNKGNAQQFGADLRFLSELVTRFRVVAVEPAEFACLKAVILFKSETRGLKVRKIATLLYMGTGFMTRKIRKTILSHSGLSSMH